MKLKQLIQREILNEDFMRIPEKIAKNELIEFKELVVDNCEAIERGSDWNEKDWKRIDILYKKIIKSVKTFNKFEDMPRAYNYK